MNRFLLLSCVGGLLAGCTPPDESACVAGVREEFTSMVDGSEGTHEVITSQCVSSKWTWTECDEATDHCWYFFEPNTPAEVPLSLIFDDFVFKHSVGSLDVSPPEILAGSTNIPVALNGIAEAAVAGGYRASPVQPFTMFDEAKAYEVTISCDHPSVDEVCPFTWKYAIVDLDDYSPGFYADFSIQYANFVDAGNVASELPEEFVAYQEMVDSIELSIEDLGR